MRKIVVILILLVAAVVSAKEARLPDKAMKCLLAQVVLDRQNYSPGEMDGSFGTNSRRALAAYEESKGESTTAGNPRTCSDVLKILQAPEDLSPVTEYTIKEEDVRGPFVDSIPKEIMDQAKLKALSYTSPLEEISEKFHASPSLMKRLNPGTSWKEGEKIQVPNIDLNSSAMPSKTNPKQKLKAFVTVSTSSLRVLDESGKTIFWAPVTAGSEKDPLPFGTWKVNGVSRNPEFQYHPELFWDARPTDSKATLPPGPNNPVGVVWIDLNAPHYGLHGTPEPSKIGYTESHGCVRLTNWDALRVASLLSVGSEVLFQQDEWESENQPQTSPGNQPVPQSQPQTQTQTSFPQPAAVQQPAAAQKPAAPQQKAKAEPWWSQMWNDLEHVADAYSGSAGNIRKQQNRPQPVPVKPPIYPEPRKQQMQPPITSQSDVGVLKRKKLLLPVKGIALERLTDSFYESRGPTRRHEAIDILAPRNTPVLAVEDGRIAKLWFSVPGGITIYQYDPTERYAYYYAHLEKYSDQVKEGVWVHRGQVIGYVGTSGNAPPNTPHLHFTIFKLTPDKHWWQGQAINPYTVFKG